MEVRNMIAKLMKDKEVTYAELEKRTGLPRSVLNRYVNGVTKKIPIDNLEKIAKALGVPPVYFVVGDIEIRPEDGRTYIDPAAAIAREAIGSVPEEPSVNQAKEKAEFMLEALERLTKLYNSGALTQEEFTQAKKKLLEV